MLKSVQDIAECQRLIDRMDLRSKYPNSKGNLDIIDVFSGIGIFSTMLNYELKPRNHVVIEKEKANVAVWESRMKFLEQNVGNKENFRFFNLNGYEWSTFRKIIDEKKGITPVYKDRAEIHDELLIVANLTSPSNGEHLLAQWIQCTANRNWLQKYGRVRMYFFVRNVSSLKFLSSPGFRKRNRAALKRDIYTETHLHALADSFDVSELTPAMGYDPKVVFDEQPIILSKSAVFPTGGDISMIEVIPRNDLDGVDIAEIDFLCQSIMYKSQSALKVALLLAAPGIADIFANMRPELLNKDVRLLTREDFFEFYRVYQKWPFKPPFEDTLDILMEEPRHW